ncbi:MAG TPA: phosphatidylserine decarboxylase family protein [Nitrospiria bacterium]|nr:phosphatidylserine decarboxylase family protein [Nitrospiria bacterium]
MTEPKTKTPLIATEGVPILLFVFGIFLLSAVFGWVSLSIVSGLAVAFVAWFFRNPERRGTDDPKAVISPADGEIISIGPVKEERLLRDKALRISIFMNVFNVHVNRVPFSGKVRAISYTRGKFFAANAEKASQENEQNAILLETETGKKIVFIQIAGLIARRIVCYLKEGDAVIRGERCGIIKFGSRVDVYLPPDTQVLVKLGDKVRAGETVIGAFND